MEKNTQANINSSLHFSVPYVRILDEKGTLIDKLPSFLGSEKLLNLYRKMLLVRLFDQKAVNLQRTGKLSSYPPSLGQEAVSAAIGQTMLKEDVFLPSYRDQGVLFQRGLSLENAFAWWAGDERGNIIDCPYSDYPPCIPIATQCLHAAGVAYAIKFQKEKKAVVVILGDGATSKGDFYEAINLAGVWNLPLVFVINNNQWAISVPLHKQTKCKFLSQKAIAGDIKGVTVDGNDVIALSSVMEKAITQAREQCIPTVVEALTYRLLDHTTADDSKRYRNTQEVEEAWEKEPVSRFQTFLKNAGILNDEIEKTIRLDTEQAILLAFEKYSNFPPQSPTSIFDYVYEKWPEVLIDQKEEIKREELWK